VKVSRLVSNMVNDYVGFNFLAGIEKVPFR